MLGSEEEEVEQGKLMTFRENPRGDFRQTRYWRCVRADAPNVDAVHVHFHGVKNRRSAANDSLDNPMNTPICLI